MFFVGSFSFSVPCSKRECKLCSERLSVWMLELTLQLLSIPFSIVVLWSLVYNGSHVHPKIFKFS